MPLSTGLIVGIFDDPHPAELAYDALRVAGYSDADLGFVSRNASASSDGPVSDALRSDTHTAGAATGAAAGAVLGAVAALLVPGVGPVISAGLLTSALGFGAAGAAVGGILGAMTGLGLSDDQARHYDQLVRAGKTLLAVRTGLLADATAPDIIRQHGGYFLGDAIPPTSPDPAPTLTPA